MTEDYELVDHLTGGEHYLALGRIGRPDVIDEMQEKPELNEALYMALTSASKVRSGGIQFGLRTKIITPVTSSLYLYELKARSTVWRVLAYLHRSGARRVEPVMLFHVRGHQGKTGRLPKSVVDKGKRLAVIARKLMEEEYE